MVGNTKASLWMIVAALALLLVARGAAADTVGGTPITVGSGPVQEQLSPDASKMIVSNETSNTVSIVSTASDTVAATISTGTDPGPIRYLPDGSKAYVANFLSNDVSVIILATDTLAATVPVGASPITLSASNDGTKVYVVNEDSNTVSVIASATNTVSKTVNVGAGPYGVNANGADPADVAVDPGLGRVYVANNATKNLAVIDENPGPNQHKVVGMVGVGAGPRGVAVDTTVTPHRVFVSTDTADRLYVINASTNGIITTVNTGTGPSGVAVDETTHRVYVANLGTSTSIGSTVSVIDETPGSGNEHKVIATVNVGAGPSSIAVNPTNHKVYVTNNGTTSVPGTTVSVIDGDPAHGAVNTVITTVTGLGNNPRGVAVYSGAPPRVYVANGGTTSLPGSTVSVIDGATDTVVGSPIVVGSGPSRVGVDQVNNKVYVSNNFGPGNTVSIIDGASGTVTGTTTVGTGPSGLAVNSSTNTVYVGNKVSDTVSVINGFGALAATVTLGSSPHSIAKSPDGTKIYIANQYSNTITVLNTATDTVTANIAVDPSPGSIHFHPLDPKAYVSNRGCADSFECSPLMPPTISVINVASNTVTSIISANVGAAGAAPHSMRITPDGTRLYVVNKHTNEVKVVNLSLNSVIATIPLTTGICADPISPPADPAKACPVRIELTSDGSRAYVVDEATTAPSGSVSVICTGVVLPNCGGFTANTVMATLTVGNKPVDIEINCLSNKAYVSNTGSNSVSVITLSGVPSCAGPGDSDGDGVNNADEVACGSDPNNASRRPERIDGAFFGVDDDGDLAIDEALPAGAAGFDCDGDGYAGAAEGGTPLCGNAKNDDDKVGVALLPDDTVIDDGCPGGPAQVGAFSEAQFHIGGNDQDPCGLASWPNDFVSGGVPESTNKINVLDLTSFIAPVASKRLNTAPGQPTFDKRWDLIPGRGVFNDMINVTDLTSLIAGTSGFPPMLGGVRAFNGPLCPWPP